MHNGLIMIKLFTTSKRLTATTTITCKQHFDTIALWVPAVICPLLPRLALSLQLQAMYKSRILTVNLQNCENK